MAACQRITARGVAKQLELPDEVLGAVGAVDLVLGEHLTDELFEVVRRVRALPHRRQRGHLGVEVPPHHLEGRRRLERRSAGDHLKEQDAQRVQVTPAIDLLFAPHLGGHVVGRAHGHAGLGERLHLGAHAVARVDDLRDAEVQDLDVIGPARQVDQHDVAWLEVAVDHADPMGPGEGQGDLPCDGDRPLPPHRAVGDDLGQLPTVEVLEHEVLDAVLLAEVDDLDDVGMTQMGQGCGLAAEPSREVVTLGVARLQDLDRHRAAELFVHSGVDRPERPPAEQTSHPAPLVEDQAFQIGRGHPFKSINAPGAPLVK